MKVLPVVILVVILFIDYYIFNNVMAMQKEGYQCKCAKTWHLKNISQVIIANIAIQLINAIAAFILMSHPSSSKGFMIGLVGIIGLGIQIYYLYLMISYINQLKNTNCACVEDKFTNIMSYYAWAKVYFFMVVILAGIMFAVGISMMKMKSLK